MKASLISVGLGTLGLAVFFSLSMAGIAESRARDDVPPEFVKMENPVSLDDDVLAAVEKVFKKRCKKCHGKNGDGKGPGAKDMEPAPRDYTDKAAMEKLSDGQMFWTILNGSSDTEMKGWKQGVAKEGKEVSEEQAWGLVYYIRQFAN